MSKYLERRNIDLHIAKNGKSIENQREFNAKSYRSPHKQMISYKTQMKRSRSRHKKDKDSIDESLTDDNFETKDNGKKQNNKSCVDISSQPIGKPFSHHNSNPRLSKDNIHFTPFSANAQESNHQLSTGNANSNYETENREIEYAVNKKKYNKAKVNNKKLMLNKSQNNLSKILTKTSPNKDFDKIKKKIDKHHRSPLNELYQMRKNMLKSNEKLFKSKEKMSPATNSVRNLRSNSPGTKFNPRKQLASDNPMDVYRRKRLKQFQEKKKSSNEKPKDRASNEKLKKNIQRQTIGRSKYKLNKIKQNPNVKLYEQGENKFTTEKSCSKSNYKAGLKSPKALISDPKRKVPVDK